MESTDTQIEYAAAHLQSLGVPPHAIERHLAGLTAAAKHRAAELRSAQRRGRRPTEAEADAETEPPPRSPPVKSLTPDQLRELVVVLRSGHLPWRWGFRQPPPSPDDTDADRNWIGHAVHRVIGRSNVRVVRPRWPAWRRRPGLPEEAGQGTAVLRTGRTTAATAAAQAGAGEAAYAAKVVLRERLWHVARRADFFAAHAERAARPGPRCPARSIASVARCTRFLPRSNALLNPSVPKACGLPGVSWLLIQRASNPCPEFAACGS